MYTRHYSLSLKAGVLHFAAHSHHPRPNVTRGATVQCWDDAANMLDNKWKHIFSTVVPEAQKNVAELLDVEYPQNIAFAPNTHEFVARIVSVFDPSKTLRILTTTSEFRSFSRHAARLKERSDVFVKEVPVFPCEGFIRRFVHELKRGSYDLIFLSQVFFDSGFRIQDSEMEEIVSGVGSEKSIIVIDGYHGFCAVPTSLRQIQNRVFYMAGGYKYAQWGEGACFLYVPPSCTLRPENTGWFAEFGDLGNSAKGGDVCYPNDGFRFWGSTFDPAGLYRLNAVAKWMREELISISALHSNVRNLQSFFTGASGIRVGPFRPQNLITPSVPGRHGNFLSYDCGEPYIAKMVEKCLREANIIVDTRGQFLRVGFGIYHDMEDVNECARRIRALEVLR